MRRFTYGLIAAIFAAVAVVGFAGTASAGGPGNACYHANPNGLEHIPACQPPPVATYVMTVTGFIPNTGATQFTLGVNCDPGDNLNSVDSIVVPSTVVVSPVDYYTYNGVRTASFTLTPSAETNAAGGFSMNLTATCEDTALPAHV